MNFPLNANGGWIVPDGTEIPANTVVPAYSQFGDRCRFRDWCRFGSECEFGDWCGFGDRCKFGSECGFGDWCKFGNWCGFGDRCKFGSECVVEGVTLKWLMTAANIDGSGRQILIVSDGDTVLVRAGCFLGSVKQFTAKAVADDKHVYAAVIPAMVAARQSIEGRGK